MNYNGTDDQFSFMRAHMGIISKGSGDDMLLYRLGCDPAALEDHPGLPLVFVCIIARRERKTLLVYSAWRQQWEVPAGMIEPGEDPAAAALRELAEESGQSASNLVCAGLCLIRLGRSGRLELGAIFTADLDPIRPFATDGETRAMLLWDGVDPLAEPEPLPGDHLDEITVELCRLA
jgi:8-oxo-dGTP diphosphatase